MTLTNLNGIIRFHVAGQEAMSQWQRQALQNALATADAPPESLRFQCRIARDARKNLARVELDDGETLTLHGRARPQFGKNSDGHAFLTATMTYSGDGESYSVRWVGAAVPKKMQEVAVKHDKGLGVKPVIVGLDLSAAQVTPAWKANGKAGPGLENASTTNEKRRAKASEVREELKAGIPRGARNCYRLTDEDL